VNFIVTYNQATYHRISCITIAFKSRCFKNKMEKDL